MSTKFTSAFRVGIFGINDERRSILDLETIINAFDVMGRYLRDECSLVREIAVYGGTAILLQFPWRMMTENVDVTILGGERESAVKDAAGSPLCAWIIGRLLNNYVGGFTPKANRRHSSSNRGGDPRQKHQAVSRGETRISVRHETNCPKRKCRR